MKKWLFILTAFFTILPSAAGDMTRDSLCPLIPGGRWVYSYFSKKENTAKDDIESYVKNSEVFDGVTCGVYEVPSRSMRLYTVTGNDGIYLKGASVSLPVLGFISVNVVFKPGVLLFKFPLQKGDSWSYKGVADTSAVFLINSETRITADFKAEGFEQVELGGKTLAAWHLSASASRSWSREKPVRGDCWFADNIGLVRGETKNSRMILKTYNDGEFSADFNR